MWNTTALGANGWCTWAALWSAFFPLGHVGPHVPFVQKAVFRGKCLKPALLQVLGEFKTLFPLSGWVNIFPVGGKLCACLGLPGWSSSLPDPLPGLSAILPEETRALLGLEGQQSPALATSSDCWRGN